MKSTSYRFSVCLGILLWAYSVSALSVGTWLARSWPETDFTRLGIDLAEIQSGGPPKDGIPSIDQPRFVSIKAAREWVEAQEPVIALQVDGLARAYPLQILTYHEIVNDRLGNIPVSITSFA